MPNDTVPPPERPGAASPAAQPLAGLRVLDLSRVLAGPWCSQVLGDLGADVIKVERPGVGDETRGWGPPWAAGEDGEATAESAYYLCANRNKRSLTLDLAHPEGARIARELAARSDILLENYKVGGLARYGLDYPALAALNPRLIYCSITGFGQHGPLAERPGYDFIIQGLGGLMSVTGEADGRPGAGPQKVGVALVDILTGLNAAIGILAAVHERERSGRGQHVDLALLDTQAASLANLASNYLVSGRAPVRMGNAHPNIAPYQVLPASDGHFILAVGNDAQFARCAAVFGCPELATDPRFATNASRIGNRAELDARLEAIGRTRSKADWMQRLEAADVPCGPINRIDEVFAMPQLAAREMHLRLPHPLAGSVPLVGSPLKLSRTPVSYRRAPPLLGEHTDAILGETLGLDAEAIARLRAAGAV